MRIEVPELAISGGMGYTFHVRGRDGWDRPSPILREMPMSYKLDGAKFPTIEELVEALYPMYSDKMSEEDFKKYVEEHAEKS